MKHMISMKKHRLQHLLDLEVCSGQACNQNGGTSYTKESPATNNLQQEKGRRTQEKLGR
jgi:hypothetical protein